MKERLTPLLRLEGLSKSFGPVVAVQPLDFSVEAGDFCARRSFITYLHCHSFVNVALESGQKLVLV